MVHELTVERILLSANAAQMLLVATVRHHMHREGNLLREPFGAKSASVWFLPSVQPSVVHQLPVGGERVRADIAAERFIYQMRLHVIRMRVALREFPVAYVTRIGSFAAV